MDRSKRCCFKLNLIFAFENNGKHMSRRTKDDWVELLTWLFTRFSAWLCVPVAIAAFIFINVFLAALSSISPIFRGLATLGPTFGGIFSLIILMLGWAAGVGKLNRRNLYDRQTGLASIRDLKWSEFEQLIGEAYRRQGYRVTETGGAGADGGIDLQLENTAETVLVQCKQWRAFKVGVKPIRELFGVLMASRADRAVFVTSGVFTQEARAFAEGKRLELIDGKSLARLISSLPGKSEVPVLKAAGAEASQICPECGSSMVLRTAKRGSSAGSRFWGCAGFPRCRGTRNL